MRLIPIAGVVALMLLAGCAETLEPGTDEEIQEVVEPLTGQFVAMTESTTVQAGTPFNLTLNYLGDAETDAANLSWEIRFLPTVAEAVDDNQVADNATSGTQGNATANEGNATDGNSTQDPAPVDLSNATTYQGTGLPAAVEANLTAGNLTLTGFISHEGGDLALTPLDFVVEAPVEVLPDPCADFVAQETVTDGGMTLLPGDIGVHTFDLAPCHTLVHVAVDILIGGDMDYALFDPAGGEADSAAAFGAEGIAPESDLEASDANGLLAGEWTIHIENFASVATEYEITVTFE